MPPSPSASMEEEVGRTPWSADDAHVGLLTHIRMAGST
jgi:hypothetical protein